MRKAPLVPGEKEEVALHPAFTSYLPWHLAALAFAAAGAALALLLRSDPWASGGQGPAWKLWNHLYGNAWAAYVLALAAFTGAGLLLRLLTRRAWPLWALAGAGAATVLVAALTAHQAYATALPALVAALTVPAWALAELDRRSRTYHLTSLRIVAQGGLLRRREESLHHDDIADLDWRRGPLARLCGHATLLAVLRRRKPGDPEPRLPGLHPYPRIRAALEALIQRATTGDTIREATGLERKAADAALDLHRRGSERL